MSTIQMQDFASMPASPISSRQTQPSAQALSPVAFKTFVQVLTKTSSKTEKAPLLTSGALSTEDFFADISSFVRTLTPSSPAAEAIGVTTAENAFQGFWAAIKAAERFEQAKKIHDRGGMVESRIDEVRGIFQSVGGLNFLGYRTLMIPAILYNVDTSIQATSSLGLSAYILGMVGTVAFLMFYLMIGAWAGYSLAELLSFKADMKAHESEKLLDFLARKVVADPKIKLQKLFTENNAGKIVAFKEKLTRIALSKFASCFLQWQKELIQKGELSEKPLTKKKVKEICKTLFVSKERETRELLRSSNSKLLTDWGLTTLELIGLKLEQMRIQAKKEAKFSRVTNGDCTEAVKKALKGGLRERLKEEDPFVKEAAQTELSELKGKIVSENTKNQWIHSALIAIAILGVASVIIGFVLLNPAGAIALAVITLLLVTGMMAVDRYMMLEGWKKGKAPGQYDKIFIIVICLVMIAALAVSIGVTLGFQLLLLPMILSCGVGGVNLALGALSYYQLTQKEKDWRESHPDLQRFKILLDSIAQDAELNAEATALFKKLSKEDRLAIRKKYSELNSKGECHLRQEKYKQWNIHNDFERFYLMHEIYEDSLDETESLLMLSAMKKSVKFFWEKWAETQDPEDCKRALKLQSALERVKQKQRADLPRFFCEWVKDDEIYNRLKKEIWYVVKRQESVADLNHVVSEVIKDRMNTLPIATEQAERAQIAPLIRRVCKMDAA